MPDLTSFSPILEALFGAYFWRALLTLIVMAYLFKPERVASWIEAIGRWLASFRIGIGSGGSQ